jgi:hypothetical protein
MKSNEPFAVDLTGGFKGSLKLLVSPARLRPDGMKCW